VLLLQKTADVTAWKYWISCTVEQFIVGFIRGSHGVTGNFKVESTSGEFEHFCSMTEVTLRNPKSQETKLYKVEKVEAGSDTLFMKLTGINSPEEVKKINGFQIMVSRDNACPLYDDEWYVEDLKDCTLLYYPEQGEDGLAVRTAPTKGESVKVGTITDVMEGGSGDLLEIVLAEDCNLLADDVKLNAKGKPNRVYIPFKFDFVRNIDIKNKTVQLMHLWILE